MPLRRWGGASLLGSSRHPRSLVRVFLACGLGLVEEGLGLGLEGVYLLLADWLSVEFGALE